MTSYTSAPPRASPPPAPMRPGAPLTEGPRWYRARIRSWGPLLALLVPGLIGSSAFAALQVFDTPWSGAFGLIGGVVAAPGLLVAGAPFGDRDIYPIAVAGSGVLWIVVGFVASRRATRHAMATWADYWRHYFWMLGGIWAGAGVALGAATIVVGDSLL